MNLTDEPIGNLLEELCDKDEPLRATLIYRLSEPAREELVVLQSMWHEIPVERRRLLLKRMVETSEVSIDVNFMAVAALALEDEDATVRRHAIEAMWEDETPNTMRLIIRVLEIDPAAEVRAAAAQALGRFVLAGELGDLPESIGLEAENALLEVLLELEEPIMVHRRALESLSYSGRSEVPGLIRAAATHPELKMQASAIFSMGRSADERWQPDVMRALHHDEPELRYEAARAAGELFMTEAVPRLIELMQSHDREIQEVAIWSLGEIGGDEAQNALIEMTDSDVDAELLKTLEDAVNMAALSTGEFVTYIFTTDDDLPDIMDNFDDDELFDDGQSSPPKRR